MQTKSDKGRDAETERISNVVTLFPKQEMIDPLENKLLLDACRDWFSRGDVSPSCEATNFITGLSQRDRREYGLLSPVLIARSPCDYRTHEDIYLQLIQDGRLARICQFVFCAHINDRILDRKLLKNLLGVIGKQMTALTNRTANECVDILIDMQLIEEVNGNLNCKRKLGYFMIEMIMFFADRMKGFATVHGENMATAWNAEEGESHSAFWLPITAPLGRPTRKKQHEKQ
tara:strand:+ start:160 stop:852 length:693 start_codon:yes stop_codon:yes gene_type:complete